MQRRQSEIGTPSESTRFVQVDHLAPVEVTSLRAGRIAGIRTAGRRSMRIAKHSGMAGMQAEFRISFREYKSDLPCLSYETFYGTGLLREGIACRCR